MSRWNTRTYTNDAKNDDDDGGDYGEPKQPQFGGTAWISIAESNNELSSNYT